LQPGLRTGVEIVELVVVELLVELVVLIEPVVVELVVVDLADELLVLARVGDDLPDGVLLVHDASPVGVPAVRFAVFFVPVTGASTVPRAVLVAAGVFFAAAFFVAVSAAAVFFAAAVF